jgi:sugar/nucleoside kinase (ribokinase family)
MSAGPVGADDVLVIGDVMVDVVVVPSGPLQHGSDTPSRIRSMGGGSAANTACWLATLGQPVRLAGAVGDDAMGRGAVSELESAGVRFVGTRLAGAPTGACVVLIDADGERTMLPDRGANDALPADVPLAALAERPAWLHLSGYTLLDDGSRPAALAALAAAQAAGIPTSVDASSASPLLTVGGARFLDWVVGTTVLFANDDELATLDGADACLRRVTAVVAKHGPAGSSWVDRTGSWAVPAVPATVVDTVGAGDALDAGVIAAVLAGAGPQDALAQAAVVAARAVHTAGARPLPLVG